MIKIFAFILVFYVVLLILFVNRAHSCQLCKQWFHMKTFYCVYFNITVSWTDPKAQKMCFFNQKKNSYALRRQVCHPLLKKAFYIEPQWTIVEKVKIKIKASQTEIIKKSIYSCFSNWNILQYHLKNFHFKEIYSFPKKNLPSLKKISLGNSLLKHNEF
jgi:hypothetical protein